MIATSKLHAAVLLGAAGLALLTGAGGYGLAKLTSKPAVAPAPERKVLYWYDPMSPGQRFDKPGRSPFMDMPLQPRYADEDAPAASQGVRIDPTAAQNLGLRTAVVRRGVLAASLVAPGVLGFDQRALSIVQARAGGFVQKAYGRAQGDVIAPGAPLADVLVPDWAGAQAEYLAIRRSGDASLTAAARQRLKLLGMGEGLIAAVEREGRTRSVVTLTAPLGGAITRLDVRPGMTLSPGQTLAEINGLSTVWVVAAVPEAEAGAVRQGQVVQVTLPSIPDATLNGRVEAVLPEVAGETRSLQARIALPNPDRRLHPGMLASVAFSGGQRPALLAPSEAVIRTGRRAIVLLAQPRGRYQAVEVRTGGEAAGQTEILAGLAEGQTVVTSGQFLIDSEANLANLPVRPLPEEAPPPRPDGVKAHAPARALFTASGRIEAIDASSVTLSHGAVAGLGWPPMTMTFKADARLLRGMAVGDTVSFGFDRPAQGPTVRTIAKIGARP